MLNKLKFIISKINIVLRYKKKKLLIIIKYILFGNEISNFTYKINNLDEIIDIAHIITGKKKNSIKKIIEEINFKNNKFKNMFSAFFFKHFEKYKIDKKIFGRRIIWYVLARIIKPNLIIESGIEKGLATGLLTFACYKNNITNKKKSNYIGIDIKKNCNIFCNESNTLYKSSNIYYSDSLKIIKNLKYKKKIMYISDAKHNYNYEMQEFKLIKKNLKNGSLIISDTNSGSLRSFSEKNSKNLISFHEEVFNHWYNGAKTTVSYYY
jgi:cephalosporin hydroxylase